MGRNGLHINMPLNTLHSNVPPKAWQQIDKEHAAIKIIGESGIPVSISPQAMDFELCPWLKDELGCHPSIEVTSGTYSHVLMSLMNPKHQHWQVENSFPSASRVNFYPEYYSPEARFIKDIFFVLASQTVAYSVTGTTTLEQPYVGEDIAKHEAILYGGKLGLVMKGFEPILSAFFAWQRDPGNKSLYEKLFLTIRQTVETIDGIIIMPIDIEAPWVGSLVGGKIWELFFSGINKYGLAKYFMSLKEVVEYLEPNAQETRRPHRVTGTKWTKYEVQINYLARLRSKEPATDRQHHLLALAGVSDVLSGLCSKIDATKRPVLFEAKDMDGNPGTIEIGYSQEVIDLAYFAAKALIRNTSLLDEINKIDTSSLLVQRILAWAEENKL